MSSRGFTNGIAPAFVSTPSAVSRNFAEAFLQVRFPNHGGLTPAALGACAFVHRKSRNSAGQRSRRDASSGDVSPRGLRKRPCIGTRSIARWHPHTRYQERGGISPRAVENRACRNDPAAARRRTSHGTHGGTNAPPVLSARRFVGDRTAFALYKRVFRATRAGGASVPPWFRYRDCSGVRQHTVGSLPQLCGSVLANAPAEPRRANASRSCFRTRRVSANVCGIALARALPDPHGGLTPPTRGVTRATSSRDGVQTCRYKCASRITADSRPPLLIAGAMSRRDCLCRRCKIRTSRTTHVLLGMARRDCVCRRCKRVSATRGGLTPAALYAERIARAAYVWFSPEARFIGTHGGLTLAALGRVRERG